jgi:hypothetical protein
MQFLKCCASNFYEDMITKLTKNHYEKNTDKGCRRPAFTTKASGDFGQGRCTLLQWREIAGTIPAGTFKKVHFRLYRKVIAAEVRRQRRTVP